MRKFLPLLLAALPLGSCKDPRSVLDKAIQDKHFIPYELPHPYTRVGTVMHGTNKEMYVVYRPERCFPELPGDRSLRWVMPTDLPSEYRSIQFDFSAKANVILNLGTPTITLKASASYVKSVELEFGGASVEYLEEGNFKQYLAGGMPSECRAALEENPFIGQGLRVETMRFVFKEAAGTSVDLDAKLSEVVDISGHVSWKVEDKYTLVIETPKYIGYRMARVSGTPDRPRLEYATTTDKDGAWIFRAVRDFTQGIRGDVARPAERLDLL